jgi:hypothetical protein
MKVFISWSGPRSRYVADVFRSWLPRVLQSVKPWMSDEDLSAGSRWINEVSSELSQAKLGIICVTPENQHNPWLLFEAGALSKTLEQTHVCPLLFEISPSQLSGPLSQFQANEVTKEGVFKIIATLNKCLDNSQISAETLSETFDVWWPKFHSRLQNAPSVNSTSIPRRSNDELLEEIVNNTREQLRRENLRLQLSEDKDEKFDGFIDKMQGFLHLMRNTQIFSPTVLDASLGIKHNTNSEDTGKPAKNVTDVDIDTMHQVFSDIKEISVKNKEFTHNVLNSPTASEGD